MRAPEATACTTVATPYGSISLSWHGHQLRRLTIGTYAPVGAWLQVPWPVPAHEPEGRLQGQLRAYFQGEGVEFDPDLPDGVGTQFQRRVWASLRGIRCGTYLTYGGLALRLGLPKRTARAVGSACGSNPLPIIFPCHRVVAATGALAGFAAGTAWKKALLRLEGVPVHNECVRIRADR